MKGFKGDIKKLTLENDNFRKVIYTAPHSQLVVMSLNPLEEIGFETHKDNDQFLRFEKGTGKVSIEGNEQVVSDGDAVIVPSGSRHNVINTSNNTMLKLYTVYSPAHYKDGTIHTTKAEADDEQFNGQTSEQVFL